MSEKPNPAMPGYPGSELWDFYCPLRGGSILARLTLPRDVTMAELRRVLPMLESLAVDAP